MKARQLKFDPIAKCREMFHAEDGSRFGIHTTQDVEPVLEHAKATREMLDGRPMGDGVHAATIPLIIVERMMRNPALHPDEPLAGIMDNAYKILDNGRWKAWLNDPDNKLFRTGGGHIG